MRLLLAELRKVWGQRIFALCLAVLAAAPAPGIWTSSTPAYRARTRAKEVIPSSRASRAGPSAPFWGPKV